MRRFFRSFYAKLSGIFLVLLLALGVVLVSITVDSSTRFVQEADQKLNLTLAKDMAFELEPVLREGLDIAKAENLIHYMMVMNPKVEIYLLDGAGKILAFFADPPKKVQGTHIALGPVNEFIGGGERRSLIVGEDPRHPGRQKPFSAARVTIGTNAPGYLYIVLGGEKYETVSNMLKESYIVKATLMSLLITLSFTGVIGLILFSLLTRRLRAITSVVKEFDEGQMRQRIHVRSDDELGHLGTSFNHMADTIEENIEMLRQTDRHRRELIANVSHDLRSPLASIQGYLETIQMKEDTLGPTERRQYLSTILNNTIVLNRLVEELFELSKLDAKMIQPKREPFSLAELAQDLVMKFKRQAESQDIDLKADLQEDVPYVYGDIALVERALSNLIENSFHYTPHKGSVAVAVSRKQDLVEVAVSDNGSGIPETDLPHIFERFYRVEKSRSSQGGGTGLGLAIAKKILELHDATIDVASKVGVGTTFQFGLQARSGHAPQPDAV